MTRWVRSTRPAHALSDDMAEAIPASLTPPGKVATLIVPSDCQWDDAAKVATPRAVAKPATVADRTIARIATLLKGGKSGTLLLGGRALSEAGLKAAARIAAGGGRTVKVDTVAGPVR